MDKEKAPNKSDLIIEELKKKGSSKTQHQENRIKVVVFTLAGNRYAFKGEEIKEILPFSKISFVPGCPDFILGIINVRGDIESVVDINQILNLPPNTHTADTRILIGENRDIRSGILVDSVNDVVDIDSSLIHHTVSTIVESIENYVVGEIELHEGSMTLLDIDKIFSEITPRQLNFS